MRTYWQYRHYAARRMLPWQRLETHLAQISMLIAKTMGKGAEKMKLSDFLFQSEQRADAMSPRDAARAAIGFKPRPKKAA